jgi:hypothetical protein
MKVDYTEAAYVMKIPNQKFLAHVISLAEELGVFTNDEIEW